MVLAAVARATTPIDHDNENVHWSPTGAIRKTIDLEVSWSRGVWINFLTATACLYHKESLCQHQAETRRSIFVLLVEWRLLQKVITSSSYLTSFRLEAVEEYLESLFNLKSKGESAARLGELLLLRWTSWIVANVGQAGGPKPNGLEVNVTSE